MNNVTEHLLINKQQILKKIALHKAQIISSNKVLKCTCRFNHVFIITNKDDWCNSCDIKFMQEQLILHNNILKGSNHGLCIFSVSKYGIAQIICANNHIIEQSLTELISDCVQCMLDDNSSIEHNQMEYNNFFNNHDNNVSEVDDISELFNNININGSDSDVSDFYEYVSDDDDDDELINSYFIKNNSDDDSDNKLINQHLIKNNSDGDSDNKLINQHLIKNNSDDDEMFSIGNNIIDIDTDYMNVYHQHMNLLNMVDDEMEQQYHTNNIPQISISDQFANDLDINLFELKTFVSLDKQPIILRSNNILFTIPQFKL
jgi:hypothetical protein